MSKYQCLATKILIKKHTFIIHGIIIICTVGETKYNLYNALWKIVLNVAYICVYLLY